jgi:predicted DNA-binding transcriptional regulator YafY
VSQPKAARWLDLIAFLLRHRYPVTREQIFAAVADYGGGEGEERRFEAARRMFERDKDELRAIGIEIRTVRLPDAEGDEAASAYRLAPRDFYLPYIELTDRESPSDRPYPSLRRFRVTAAEMERLDRATRRVAGHPSVALASAVASARRKLGFDLPLSLAAVERVLAAPLGEEAAAALELLQRAVAERVALRCRYYSIGRAAEEERVLEPYGLFFSWSRWYCVARARDRDAVRVFRVDRMRSPRLETGTAALFEVPGSFSLREYVGRTPWELSGPGGEKVRARIAFPESRWVLAQGLGEPEEPLLEDGGAVLSFVVSDLGAFLRWMLTFGDHAEVLEPLRVRSELDALRRRVAALYSGDR